MKKIVFIIFVLMALWCSYSYNRIDCLKRDKKALESENLALRVDNKRMGDNYVALSKQKERIKILIKEDKSDFDWSRNLSDSLIISELHKSCKSCR